MFHSQAYGVPGADKPFTAVGWLIAILVLMLLAAIALFRFKAGVIPVITCCAILGAVSVFLV